MQLRTSPVRRLCTSPTCRLRTLPACRLCTTPVCKLCTSPACRQCTSPACRQCTSPKPFLHIISHHKALPANCTLCPPDLPTSTSESSAMISEPDVPRCTCCPSPSPRDVIPVPACLYLRKPKISSWWPPYCPQPTSHNIISLHPKPSPCF